jgi:hypothetical protein
MGKWWKVVLKAAREVSCSRFAVHLHIIHDRICGTGGGVGFVTVYSALSWWCGSRQTSLFSDPSRMQSHVEMTGSLES